MPDPADEGLEPGHEPFGSGQPRWVLVLVVAGAAIALLLVGAAGGLLVGTQFGQGSAATAVPAPDSVDVGFCQDMSVHHRQAATMSALARAKASDQRLRTLAFDIETTQLEQIGRMQGWLSMWGRDRLPTGSHMAWMSAEHAAAHDAGHAGSAAPTEPTDRMPGMASREELDRLGKATGADFDVLFLQLMLRHHEGGTSMLQFAADHAENPVVRNLATQTLVAQGKEIIYMRELLTERGAQPLPN